MRIRTVWRLSVLINELKIQAPINPNKFELWPANPDENVGAHLCGISSCIGLRKRFSVLCAFRQKRRERKKEKRANENRATPSRKHVGATHPENWSSRSESGTIYIGAPPQSTPQEARDLFAMTRGAEDPAIGDKQTTRPHLLSPT
ncbi:hypothetical protein DBV15_06189 [Temnothorax longispinosus]|uniref:Uncharacterized protein n=1 Tax=Temnothorax longispinosus TaxID=300112 RepID=A0A4S2JLY3_9HYME|nr:hypothetical protein DBV15_06189 [Temnothorax longispinosus]